VNEARQRSVAQISAVLPLRDTWHTAAMHREQKPENRMDVIATDDHVGGAGHLDPRALGLVKAAYSVRETCELLSIGRSSLYAAMKRGELRRVKVGKKTLLCATDLVAFLTRR
jgi:excisionase family DNA binding protein